MYHPPDKNKSREYNEQQNYYQGQGSPQLNQQQQFQGQQFSQPQFPQFNQYQGQQTAQFQPFQQYQQEPYNSNSFEQQHQPFPQPKQAPVPQPRFHQQPTGEQYLKDFQSSATGQLGMQLGQQAFTQAQAQISSNVGQYFNVAQWRFYFNVSNSYVFNKLKLLLFPFIHKSWSRTFDQSGDNQEVGYAPPRFDLNSPDLYIPVMAFVTYVILVGFNSGLENVKKDGFSPDVLGLTASTASFIILVEILFIKAGCYFLNVNSVPLLDLVAYTGYQFIPINVVMMSKYLQSTAIKIGVYCYCFLAFGLYTMRTLRDVIIPENSNTTMNRVDGSARKRRALFLFMLVGLEAFLAWFLT